MSINGYINKFSFRLNIYLYFVFLFIQGCSTSQIGEQLSNSFDQPEIEARQEIQLKDSKKQIDIGKNRNDLKQKNLNSSKSKQKIMKVYSPSKNIPFNPKPYRITIKLSGANPSFPSESVTKALIKAGVEFEVEMIQRIEDGMEINNSSRRGIRR